MPHIYSSYSLSDLTVIPQTKAKGNVTEENSGFTPGLVLENRGKQLHARRPEPAPEVSKNKKFIWEVLSALTAEDLLDERGTRNAERGIEKSESLALMSSALLVIFPGSVIRLTDEPLPLDQIPPFIEDIIAWLSNAMTKIGPAGLSPNGIRQAYRNAGAAAVFAPCRLAICDTAG
jgi:hypothetical protein